jgi:hypothetical protein
MCSVTVFTSPLFEITLVGITGGFRSRGYAASLPLIPVGGTR